MITSKLPEVVLRQLELNKGLDQEWTVDSLREGIRKYVSACEKAEKSSKESKEAESNKGRYIPHKPYYSRDNNLRQQRGINYPARTHIGSAEALVSSAKAISTKSYREQCRYCEGRHWSDECKKHKTVEQRKLLLKDACFKCLKKGHTSKGCKSKKSCVYCGEHDSHHRSLCEKKFGYQPASVHLTEEIKDSPRSKVNVKTPALVSSDEIVLMQTAQAEISDTDHVSSETVRIMLDSGSQRTYITQRLAKKLSLKAIGEQQIKLVTFGSDKPKIIKTKSVEVVIGLKNGLSINVIANIVPTISGSIQRSPVQDLRSEHVSQIIQTVDLADTIPNEKEMSTTEFLLGNDYYLDVVLPQRIELKPGLYLLGSKLGWIISGRTSELQCEEGDVPSMLILTHGTNIGKSDIFTPVDRVIPVKPDLTDFWNLEAIGIKDDQHITDDENAMQNFKSTLKFEEGRYQVTWPWKEKDPDLPRNRELAYGRLQSCIRKLRKTPNVLDKYDAIIEDQLQKGIIEKVDKNKAKGLQHYIPHHAVVTPKKTTTKVRIVYDASAKTKAENNSLNDCLHRGPVLLHDLCGLLMRFRMHPVAIVSDIEKAFLQIGLQPGQRDVTRFLWLKNIDNPSTDQANVQEFRFCRVPFGVISSPFLLAATVESHLESYGNNVIAQQLKNDIYVDNVITGTDDTKSALELYSSAKQMFNEASMNLREWLSNSEEVNQSIPIHDRADTKNTTILGHLWDCQNDTLCLKGPKDTEHEFTKRNILKFVASVFDPLGLFSPVLLPGKVLLQDLWSRKLEWDDLVQDTATKIKWECIKAEIELCTEYQFPRCIVDQKGIKDVTYKLVCFCDASAKAYAASVYLCQKTSTEGVKSNLIFAKTRLAPVKKMTIPRLELMAVLIGARCLQFVMKQLNISVEALYLLTDSQCVLGWLKSQKKLPVFVNNRVKEITSYSEVRIGYINTRENPADLASRGTTAKELKSSQIWWEGPKWLQQPENEWNFDIGMSKDENNEEIQSMGTESDMNVKTNEDRVECPFMIKYQKYSSLTKLIRVTAYAARFLKIVKKQDHEKEHLSCMELQEAEKRWLLYVQQKHFAELQHNIKQGKSVNLQRQLGLYVDNDGLIRCRGRLQHASLDESAKCPILLPSKEKLTLLVIQRVHKNILHSGVSHTLAGVRQRFWIIRGRATVRTVLKGCIVCRRHEGGPYRMPPMAPLPETRVMASPAFTYTGLDYMGPIYVHSKNGPTKTWVCLFTCLVTRAVHLELVLDVSTKEFLMCLRRFVAQRGSPYEIISDNALQFKAASAVLHRVWRPITHSQDVQTYLAEKAIKWNFIVELAPWMGGFYERMVGVVKRALRKSIGRNLLNVIQLQTLLKEVETVTNSRPLIYVGDDINSSLTLTPSHFLTLNPRCGIPEGNGDKPDLARSHRDKIIHTWKSGQTLLNMFWKIWKDDYLLSLRERMQSSLKAGRVQSTMPISVGDVVIIKDAMPRGSWKMGKVTELVKSRDRKIRSAKVKLATGRVLGRPLKLLYPLECCDFPTEKYIEQQSGSRRTTRKAAEVAKLKIKDQLSNLD